jgi:hypothetical protein
MSAASNGRTALQVRREIERERQQLASALETLRGEIGRATDVTARLREHLPLAAAGALAAGFVLAGGIGATVHLVARRRRPPPLPPQRGLLAFLRRS